MLPFGVLVQELFRWVYFKGFAGLCHLLKRGTPSIEFSTHEQLGIAVGKQSSWLGVDGCAAQLGGCTTVNIPPPAQRAGVSSLTVVV